MDDTSYIAQLTISEVLGRWPATATIFNEHNMACVGCAVASYYTIADAADVYGLAVEEFVAELRTSIAMVAED